VTRRIPAQPRYLRSGQVAKLMGLSPKTVSRYAKEGKLPFVRTLGNHRRYPEAEIRELLATNTFRPDEEAF
jgi:excisionase family DNA binding protein